MSMLLFMLPQTAFVVFTVILLTRGKTAEASVAALLSISLAIMLIAYILDHKP